MRRTYLSGLFLLAVSLTGVADLASEPRVVACGYNLRNIATCLEMYASDNQGQYPKSLKQVVPTYIKTLPTCYAANRDTYSASYHRRGTTEGTFYCQGSFHSEAGMATNQPSYDSANGLGPPGLSERMERSKKWSKFLPMPAHTRCMQNIVDIATAMENYATDHRGQYPHKLQILVPRYLKSIPKCRGIDTYTPGYQVRIQPDDFTFCCRGKNHTSEGYLPNRPLYNAERGMDK